LIPYTQRTVSDKAGGREGRGGGGRGGPRGPRPDAARDGDTGAAEADTDTDVEAVADDVAGEVEAVPAYSE
ncbi:MAG TPA: hypothetical protein VNT52_17100, partial [Acidimicrobiales bacterium]|nr:hypothetical protein [Acidimicrobiales bacterium]